ncbi:hypothetical protein F4860DRAFT_389228 [Xylaria cubensis]|nr:hypothetical protein F4860DRAFT_389228 [Xylaria cubensis]
MLGQLVWVACLLATPNAALAHLFPTAWCAETASGPCFPQIKLYGCAVVDQGCFSPHPDFQWSRLNGGILVVPNHINTYLVNAEAH